MRRSQAVLLCVVLALTFAAGLSIAPVASASAPVCWYALCGQDYVVCCEGQVCCPPPPQCHGDPPVCW